MLADRVWPRGMPKAAARLDERAVLLLTATRDLSLGPAAVLADPLRSTAEHGRNAGQAVRIGSRTGSGLARGSGGWLAAAMVASRSDR